MGHCRVALIPGGAKGIGRAIAEALIQNGWDVAVAYRNSREAAEQLVQDANSAGARAVAIQADVCKPDEADRVVAKTESTLGAVDALVHCVGPFHRVHVLEETPEGWREALESNLSSYFYVARRVVPGMVKRGWGRIVAFGLANADRLSAQPNLTAHSIAKAGVITLTRTLAKDLGDKGITANVISPGFIDSGSQPMEDFANLVKSIPAGYVGKVDDAVALAQFLLSDEARYITGANIPLAGGWGL